MLRTTSVLPKSVLKWVSQVAASLGAALSATLIWSAVPHPGAAPAPQPELTSGGKFAARAVGPGQGAVGLKHRRHLRAHVVGHGRGAGAGPGGRGTPKDDGPRPPR